MRKNFNILFLAGSILLQTGCGGGSDNANQANSNAASPTPAANTNANVQTQVTPLPQFTDADTAFAEGNKLFDANKTELAVEAYNQAVKLNPDFAEAWFKLGVSYSQIEKQNEIESINEEVTETPTPTPKKSSKNSKEKIIRTKDSEKAFEKAVAAYKKIIAKNKEDDVSLYNLGRAYNKLDEDEDAEKVLRQAVKLKPEDTVYQTEFGAILIKLARYDEAVKALKKALEIDADNSEAAELLEKAEAGKKRVNFGVTPKMPQQQENAPKSRQSKPTETQNPEGEGKPETKPSETKPEKKPEPKLDKKGGQ